jgi:hypothetical protein
MPPLISVHERLNRTCFPMYFVIFFFLVKKKITVLCIEKYF